MTAESIAADLARQAEGCSLVAYADPGTHGAPWTIGRGHTGPEVHQGLVWTQAQVDAAFEADIAKAVAGVRKLLKQPATANQVGAMADLAFNIGMTRFANSTLLRLFNDGNAAAAAKQFNAWVMAAGKVMPGLVTRRAAERKVFETPDFSGVTSTVSWSPAA